MKAQTIEVRRVFAGSSQLSIPQNDACALHMTRMRRVRIDGDSYISRVARGQGLLARRSQNILFC